MLPCRVYSSWYRCWCWREGMLMEHGLMVRVDGEEGFSCISYPCSFSCTLLLAFASACAACMLHAATSSIIRHDIPPPSHTHTHTHTHNYMYHITLVISEHSPIVYTIYSVHIRPQYIQDSCMYQTPVHGELFTPCR